MSEQNQPKHDISTSQNGKNLSIDASTATIHLYEKSAGSLSSSPISNSPLISSPISLSPHSHSSNHSPNDDANSNSNPNPNPDNNHVGCIQSGMEKASLLILAYIRRQHLKDEIPLAITSIITHFYPKMNGKLFCWHIDNPNIIKNFINAKHKQRFASDIFEMKNLKWYLSAYPNGDRKEGSCTVYLTLISFPSIWSKFICNYSIYCNQTRSSATYITTYTEKRSQSGRIAGLLSIDEIKSKYNSGELNAITFSVNVNILQIYDRKPNKSLIYQYKNMPCNRLSNKYIIIWNVSAFLVSEFLRSDAIKQYETDVYYDMFCLAFCPNGGWRENQGQARLSLKLCCLPCGISRIKVKMELLCVETETYYSDICDFGYDSKNTVRAWPTDMLLTPQLNGLKKLTFKCMVAIIAKYDRNGQEINDNISQNIDPKININQDNNINNDVDGVQVQVQQISNQLSYDNININEENQNQNNNELQAQIKQVTMMLDSLTNQINNITSILDNANLIPTNSINSNQTNIINENVIIKENINIVNDDIKWEDEENDGLNVKGKDEQVRFWINKIVGIGRENNIYELFVSNGLNDMDIIKELTMDELVSVGIKKLGHRKRIMQEIKKLNNIKISKIFWHLYSTKKIH